MNRYSYFIVALVVSVCLQGQAEFDSSVVSFRLKKFRVGIELGISPPPPNHRYVLGQRMKRKPYYKFDLGYNHKLNDNTFFTCALGLSQKEFDYTNSSSSRREFEYINITNNDTVIVNSTKSHYWYGKYYRKRIHAVFSIGAQWVHAPFKSKDLMMLTQIGFAVKPVVWSESKTIFTHIYDSVANNVRTELDRFEQNSNYQTKIKLTRAIEYQLSISPGLIYKQGSIQHHYGLGFLLETPNPNLIAFDFQFSVRLFYSLYFGG